MQYVELLKNIAESFRVSQPGSKSSKLYIQLQCTWRGEQFPPLYGDFRLLLVCPLDMA